MKKGVLAGLMMTLLVFSCQNTSKDGISLITSKELQELKQKGDVQLVDVRTPEEYKAAFIDGFQNIDYLSASFNSDVEKLDKTKPIIVYCKSGGRSADCAAVLKEKGFVQIFDLDGGIAQWRYDGFEVKSLQ
ncbi:MAG: rhodanese-like domain-containing protein [Flavobacteriaceae bacterium]|nr:rhodanese-like domain-containing protein [Flavobacteriaceae bacterium]